jgi:ClpP class serine protease
MPNWTEVLNEMNALVQQGNPFAIDVVRKKYIVELNKLTGRNVITYYSGWLHRPNELDSIVNDKDKNAFMANIHGMDRSKGLDIILHTPGGDIAATESLVDYLHKMFGNNIRAIIPQLSMSAGTMMALSCNAIVMGKQSNLGPIDPQMGGIACQAILDEFEQAKKEVSADPSSTGLWQVIIGKYHPTLLGECKNAIDWSEKLVGEWLERNMCNGKGTAKKVLKEFSDHSTHKSHARHISMTQCQTIGLNILEMEKDNTFQDAILTIHHCYMHTFANSFCNKIVENQLGISYVEKSVGATP